MPDELPIPPVAAADKRSVEMIRVWIAKNKLQCVLNIGFWEERGINERQAWGILLADMIHHIANAHEEEYGHDPRASIAMIREAFEAEMGHATSKRKGEFVKPVRKPRRSKK